MKFGDYDCIPVDMGSFLLDGGAMFGMVPKVLWAQKIPADENNKIPMKGRALLIKGKNRNILIDTGCGTKFDDKTAKIYGMDGVQPDIATQLEKAGVRDSDITDVVLTHLHFDHAGGATKYCDGKVIPTFRNATYYVHKAQWETALLPSPKDKASYFPENYIPLQENGVLQILEDGENPFEDIEFIISNGHTTGQLLPVIKSELKALFYCGDLIPTSAHIPIAWHMGYDNYPIQIIEEKKAVLERAFRQNWTLFFEHDPKIAACTLKKTDRGIELSKIVDI